ncbi:hypothetical protein J4216_05675 [Candidatus Woesearchaeota archaeon]|nr:hypothetical protein [Candidatus Woesearchaeota archaeon]
MGINEYDPKDLARGNRSVIEPISGKKDKLVIDGHYVKIFMLDDDKTNVELTRTLMNDTGYDFEGLDLPRTMVKPTTNGRWVLNLPYWENLGMHPLDLLLLDINFGFAEDTTKKGVVVPASTVPVYSAIGEIERHEEIPEMVYHDKVQFDGRNVFSGLVEARKQGKLEGLSKVLIATTLQSEITQPYILNALPYTQGGFDVYAMQREREQPYERRQESKNIGGLLDVVAGVIGDALGLGGRESESKKEREIDVTDFARHGPKLASYINRIIRDKSVRPINGTRIVRR